MSRALPVSARSQASSHLITQRPGEMAVSLRIVARSNELIRELICPSCAGTGLQVIYRSDESRVLQRFASQVHSVPQKCLYIHTHAQWMTPAVMFWCGCAHGARGGTVICSPQKKKHSFVYQWKRVETGLRRKNLSVFLSLAVLIIEKDLDEIITHHRTIKCHYIQ